MRESILEIRRFVHTLDHYGGMAKTMRTSAVMLDTGRHGLVLRKPLGVCGSIVPWNFPGFVDGQQTRSGAARRQLRRGQAGRHDAADRSAHLRDHR